MKTLTHSLTFVQVSAAVRPDRLLLGVGPWSPARRLVLLLVLLTATVWPRPAWALTEYYLDPHYTGIHSGTQSQPFSTLDASAWSTINGALATDNVTVYCSARKAGADTNQLWGVNVDVTQKTPAPSFTLTFDGRSKWNSNDTTPSWSAYSGASKCQVTGFLSQNGAHTKYNNVTIDGFVIAQSGAEKAVSICGDNWLLQNSDISYSASPSGWSGPTVLIVPTADGAHEGSSAYCPAMTNITIQNNTIHDSDGENIYVGGAGCSLSGTHNQDLQAPDCQGMPAHNHINILNNIVHDGGVHGGQGDGFDIKGAITYLTIRGNTIYNMNDPGNASIRAMVFQGIQTGGPDQHIVVERNLIQNITATDGAIALCNSWGTPNGYTIRNNIIYNVTTNQGIKVYDAQSSVGVFLYNNTIYNSPAEGIAVDAGAVTVENNALLANNAGGPQTRLAGTITSDHNAYGGTWAGTCTTCVSGLTTAAFANPAGGTFTLTSTSALIGRGMTIASFSDDYAGTTRPQGAAWDIGAYEFGVALTPPTGLRLR